MATVKLADSIRKLIIYYRVSSKKQGMDGLGMDGQDIAVAQYVAAYGGVVIREYKEVETGKIADRPELQKAIAHAKRSKATLIIAKLDRLARNVEFTATLMNTKVDFVCCDNPHATRLTIHILAAVAEDEVRRISERTGSALQAYVINKRVPKRLRDLHPEGVPAELVEMYAGKLGASHPDCKQLTYEHSLKGTAKAAQLRSAEARDAYSDILDWIKELKAEGRSLRDVAAILNSEGHTTRNGASWAATTVMRVLKMAS